MKCCTKIFFKGGFLAERCDTYQNCRFDFGGQLTATAIAEPGTIFGLLFPG
ncbi:hypothetical protein [Nostoc sp.]|uniref:hypothetical protein n=1 Tax=Nostoc sp. TaxID=1180 RepID=UPI002FF97338